MRLSYYFTLARRILEWATTGEKRIYVSNELEPYQEWKQRVFKRRDKSKLEKI